jgi:glutamine cyclotransferase
MRTSSSDGKIYANVLPQDRIAIIQPDTGQVTGWIDLAELKSRMPRFAQSLCIR